MRMDKYLKVSRIIKRRTLAQEFCAGGRVKKNGVTAKPSTEVTVGDTIQISFGQRSLSVKVLETLDSADKSMASTMYEVLSGTQEGE